MPRIKTVILSISLWSISSAFLYAQTQRPLKTESARIIPSGDIRLEIGAEYLYDTSPPFAAAKNSQKRISVPSMGITVGIRDYIEIETDFELINIKEKDRASKYDVGDIKLWTKIRLLDEKDSRPAIAVRFGTKLPNASNEGRYASDETDFFFTTIYSKHFGNLYTSLNAGLGILGDPNKNTAQDDVIVFGLGALLPLSDNLILASEIYGQGGSRENNNLQRTKVGLQYKYNDITFDIYGNAGISDEAEEWGIGTGITWRFHAFDLN